MTTLTVSLPEALTTYLQEQLASGQYNQHSGQFFGEGLEKSYPPHRVQVYEKYGAPMDSLKSILAGLLGTAGHLANRSGSF